MNGIPFAEFTANELLLKEKEHDLQVAAQIGARLVSENNRLSIENQALIARLNAVEHDESSTKVERLLMVNAELQDLLEKSREAIYQMEDEFAEKSAVLTSENEQLKQQLIACFSEIEHLNSSKHKATSNLQSKIDCLATELAAAEAKIEQQTSEFNQISSEKSKIVQESSLIEASDQALIESLNQRISKLQFEVDRLDSVNSNQQLKISSLTRENLELNHLKKQLKISIDQINQLEETADIQSIHIEQLEQQLEIARQDTLIDSTQKPTWWIELVNRDLANLNKQLDSSHKHRIETIQNLSKLLNI